MNSRDANVQSDEQALEAEIQAKGLNAPRLTPMRKSFMSSITSSLALP